MNSKQRTAAIGAVVALLAIGAGLLLTEPVYVLLAVAVAVLVALVVVNRLRVRADADEGWDEHGDEWGLADAEQDDYIDLDERLGGLGLSGDAPADEYDESDEWEHERAFDQAAVYEVEAPQPAVEIDEYEHDAEYTAADEYAAADEYEVADEYEEVEVAADDFDAEYEELVEEYEEGGASPSLFAAPGVIDEERLDSDEAILAASNATSLQYDEVLSREDANAETREILSRVASLLAKYE